jgi:hypothetical protein
MDRVAWGASDPEMRRLHGQQINTCKRLHIRKSAGRCGGPPLEKSYYKYLTRVSMFSKRFQMICKGLFS